MSYFIPYDMERTLQAMEHTISADNEDHSKIHVTTTPLTYTERRIFDILADGEAHSIEEILQDAMGKRFASASLIPTHIHRMRKKLAGEFEIIGKGGLYSMEAAGVAS